MDGRFTIYRPAAGARTCTSTCHIAGIFSIFETLHRTKSFDISFVRATELPLHSVPFIATGLKLIGCTICFLGKVVISFPSINAVPRIMLTEKCSATRKPVSATRCFICDTIRMLFSGQRRVPAAERSS